MKWNKETRRKLFWLLKKADELGGLGIKKAMGIPGNLTEDRDYVEIPYPRCSYIKRSFLIRAYLFQGPSRRQVLDIDSIIRQIREECFIDVPPSLVAIIIYEYKDRKINPEWRKIDLLKIPKDVAEKFLVLGVP